MTPTVDRRPQTAQPRPQTADRPRTRQMEDHADSDRGRGKAQTGPGLVDSERHQARTRPDLTVMGGR